MFLVIWEIFSKGERPYNDLNNSLVLEFVLEGKRMEKPENCPSSLYQLLLRIWAQDPKDRPLITDIQQSLQHIITNPAQ